MTESTNPDAPAGGAGSATNPGNGGPTASDQASKNGPEKGTEKGAYKPPRSIQVTFASSVLTCEAFVVFFATLVAYGLGDHSRIFVWIVGLVLAIVLVGACAVLKRSWGYAFGYALQVAIIALGFIVPAMFVVGLLFAAMWVFGVRTGARMDRERRAWDAQVLAETGELPFNDEELPKSML